VLAADSRSAWGFEKVPLLFGHVGHDCLCRIVRRMRFRRGQNVVVINNGQCDFDYAARNKSLKVRYICRLFAKELVIRNFPGYSADDLVERMIELLLRTEENCDSGGLVNLTKALSQGV
jgi:hypothetical protein